MSDAPSERARLRRNARRAVYDREAIDDILDAEMVCQVAYVVDGEPRVIPTLYIREGNMLYLHGNRQSALLKHMAAGGLVTLSVMLVDGLVVARSGFHCSMNYRSVAIYGSGVAVSGDEHARLLDLFVERLVPGHLAQVREPTEQELAATLVVGLAVDECVAKVRGGDPIDDDGDLDADVWAGVLPVRQVVGAPEAAANLKTGVAVPDYIADYRLPDTRS